MTLQSFNFKCKEGTSPPQVMTIIHSDPYVSFNHVRLQALSLYEEVVWEVF